MAQGWKYVIVCVYKIKLGRENCSRNSNLVAFHECSKHIVHLILESHACPHLHIRYLAGTSVWNFWTHLLSIKHNEGWETCINIRPKCPLQSNKLKVHKLEKGNSWIYFMLIYKKVQDGDGLGKIYPFHVVCNLIHFGCNNMTW